MEREKSGSAQGDQPQSAQEQHPAFVGDDRAPPSQDLHRGETRRLGISELAKPPQHPPRGHRASPGQRPASTRASSPAEPRDRALRPRGRSPSRLGLASFRSQLDSWRSRSKSLLNALREQTSRERCGSPFWSGTTWSFSTISGRSADAAPAPRPPGSCGPAFCTAEGLCLLSGLRQPQLERSPAVSAPRAAPRRPLSTRKGSLPKSGRSTRRGLRLQRTRNATTAPAASPPRSTTPKGGGFMRGPHPRRRGRRRRRPEGADQEEPGGAGPRPDRHRDGERDLPADGLHPAPADLHLTESPDARNHQRARRRGLFACEDGDTDSPRGPAKNGIGMPYSCNTGPAAIAGSTSWRGRSSISATTRPPPLVRTRPPSRGRMARLPGRAPRRLPGEVPHPWRNTSPPVRPETRHGRTHRRRDDSPATSASSPSGSTPPGTSGRASTPFCPFPALEGPRAYSIVEHRRRRHLALQ